jgi:drug/metabolite transporter (DMT)-like permease
MTHPATKPYEPGLTKNLWIAAMPAAFVLLWSTGFIGAKFGLPYAEPFTFLSVRFAIVIGFMLLLCIVTKAPWPSDAKLIIHIAVAGALVNGVYLGGVFSSIKTGFPVGIVALVTGLQPLLTAVLAGPLLGETVTRRQWLGILVGFIGVSLVLSDKIIGPESNLIGLVLTTIGLFGITAGTLYQKKFCARMNLRSGSVIQFSSSLIIIFPLAYLFESRDIEWTGEFIFAVFWLVIVLSVGAITILSMLIRRGAASKVASLFYLVPPTTALMSFFVFDEALGPTELFGMIAVVIGVAMVVREK